MGARSRFPALLVASLLACGAYGTNAFVPASTRIPIGRSTAGVCSGSRRAHVLEGGAVASGLVKGRARWAMKALSNEGGGYTAAEASDKRKNPDLYDSSVSISDSLTSQNPGSSGGRVLLRKPEVLSPAGGWPQLRAAVQNGCDAVYFGLDHFNARSCSHRLPRIFFAVVSTESLLSFLSLFSLSLSLSLFIPFFVCTCLFL